MSIPDRVVSVELESWMSALWHRKCLSTEIHRRVARCAPRQRPQPYDRYRRQFETSYGMITSFQYWWCTRMEPMDIRCPNRWSATELSKKLISLYIINAVMYHHIITVVIRFLHIRSCYRNRQQTVCCRL